VSSLADKLNIDWMLKSQGPQVKAAQQRPLPPPEQQAGAPEPQRPLRPSVEEALIFHARTVLEHLARDGDHTGRVHEIVDSFPPSVDFKDILGVVDFLSERGDIEIIERSKLGDHVIHLTPGGQALVGRNVGGTSD
jgi:hypothetical protein